MKLIILLVLLVSVLCVERYCNYNNNMVKESGYPPRPMTQSEKDQLVVYGQQWDQWGQQFTRYMHGMDTMPQTPVMPCFCHKCM